MPSLPPFFNGKISGVLTLSVSNITWYKNDVKTSYIQFEWTGNPEKQKLLTSKCSKITYDIRTSYESFLNYISTCTLNCSIKSYENKTYAHASVKNIFMAAQDYQLIKTLPLVNKGETVGTLQLCFNLQTFNDTSFDNDIKSLKQFGIENRILDVLNNKEFYDSKLLQSRNNSKPVSFSSLRTNRSKEELTSDYLMGKDMAPEEEEEALSTLRIMPSAESIVSVAEQIGIYSPSHIPSHIKGDTEIMTNKRPGVENINTIQTNLKKPCAASNKSKFKKDFVQNVYNAPVPKDDVYLHLSVLSINVYRTTKSLKNYINSTYIVQCFKDQEPCKSLRFMSRHVDDNVVKFKNITLSSYVEGRTAKGITLKAYVRLLSERNPVVLGETKQMLDWTGFSTVFGVPRYVKVPILNNNKITGHLSLSYEFSTTPTVEKYENIIFDDHVENVTEIKIPEKLQYESSNDPKSVANIINKNKKEDYKDITSYWMEDQIYLYDRLYPEINENIDCQLLLDKQSKKKSTKEKEIQTNFKVRQFDKSVQTLVKNCNVAVQVHSDELEDFLDKTICYDVQNIFRCTHEFTFNIEKKCNSTFDYVTYQFPECVTNTIGKVITCCRMFRTYGNANMLHLVTLPATVPLEIYFYKNYKKAAILFNLHENNENYSPGKVSLLLSHLIDIANEFKTSHITKNVILNNSLSLCELSHDNVHVKIHYKRVYHTFPSPEKPVKNSHHLHGSLKKNSKIIIDLTESDSENNSINKTYTLLKHDDRTVEMTAETGTQTEKYTKQQCTVAVSNGDSNVVEKRTEIATQTDTVVIENDANRTETEMVSRGDTIFGEFVDGDIFNAKITVVCGYNLPMVKLNGDVMPSAPTTYVIVEDHDENGLTTSSVVQQTNPVWDSEWTVVIPTSKLIEGKWLILGLWCKKNRNEYAGHDAKRDSRLGFVFIDLCALEYDVGRTGKLYDVISETEQHRGEIKIIIDPIDHRVDRTNVVNGVYREINDVPTVSATEENAALNDGAKVSKNRVTLGRIRTGRDLRAETRKERICQYVDLTKDSPRKVDETPSNDVLVKPRPKNVLVKSRPNDGSRAFDAETVSSVTSWTSSSDDILCSNNSRIVNSILNDETKMNRIKRIIQC